MLYDEFEVCSTQGHPFVDVQGMLSSKEYMNEYQCCDLFLISDLDIRLVNGPSDAEGRVEIRYNDIWGTICNDNFDDNDALVLCKMLGFK